jgi:hypothetical protein
MLGLPAMEGRSAMSAGKGDSPRPVNAEVYGQNYEDIFRKPSTEARIKLLELISNYESQPTPTCNTTEK